MNVSISTDSNQKIAKETWSYQVLFILEYHSNNHGMWGYTESAIREYLPNIFGFNVGTHVAKNIS